MHALTWPQPKRVSNANEAHLTGLGPTPARIRGFASRTGRSIEADVVLGIDPATWPVNATARILAATETAPQRADTSLYDYLAMKMGAVIVSDRMPAKATNNQKGLALKTAGAQRNQIPIWSALESPLLRCRRWQGHGDRRRRPPRRAPVRQQDGAADQAVDLVAQPGSGGDGWADVWKRHHFAWEYKGRRADLAARAQEAPDRMAGAEGPPGLRGARDRALDDPRPDALQFPQKPCENRVSSPHKRVGVAGPEPTRAETKTTKPGNPGRQATAGGRQRR